MKKILMMAAVILSSFSFMGIAEANVTAMRSEQNANGRTTVRFFGLTPGAEVQVSTGNTFRTSALFLVDPNFGDFFRISAPANATQVRVNGGSWINISSIPDRSDTLRVATVQGTRQFQGRTANDIVSTLIPASGGLMKIGNAFYFRRPGSESSIPSFEFNVPVTRVVRVNQCGFGSLAVGTSGTVNGVPPVTAVSIGANNYTLSSLPLATPANTPRCVRFGETTFVRYNPQ